jgi:hypothetical protein
MNMGVSCCCGKCKTDIVKRNTISCLNAVRMSSPFIHVILPESSANNIPVEWTNCYRVDHSKKYKESVAPQIKQDVLEESFIRYYESRKNMHMLQKVFANNSIP